MTGLRRRMINKWAGKRGGKEYARNKKEDASHQSL